MVTALLCLACCAIGFFIGFMFRKNEVSGTIFVVKEDDNISMFLELDNYEDVYNKSEVKFKVKKTIVSSQ